MKIAYLDLSPGIFEDYSLNPKRYGGGRAFAALLKQYKWFDIFADKACFENYTEIDRAKSCFYFSLEQRQAVLSGAPLLSLLPKLLEYDIIIHSHTNNYLNTEGLKAKQIVWSVGYLEQIHEKHTDLLLYNDYQAPQIKNPNLRIHKFVLGKQISRFQKQEKENYIFQCSRHTGIFNSIGVAQFCNAYGIKGVFAGPIDEGYPLLQVIDNKNTFYLGQISEEHKLLLTARARLYTMIHTGWPTPFNLSAVEALSLGTPVVCNPIGFWPTLIQHNVNGFYLTESFDQLKSAWDSAPSIPQESCYISASYHSQDRMISSLRTVFDEFA